MNGMNKLDKLVEYMETVIERLKGYEDGPAIAAKIEVLTHMVEHIRAECVDLLNVPLVDARWYLDDVLCCKNCLRRHICKQAVKIKPNIPDTNWGFISNDENIYQEKFGAYRPADCQIFLEEQ